MMRSEATKGVKVTRDNKGSVILNDGGHRITLSPEVVEAIGAQVYAASPPSEIEGRMVVVALPPRKVAIRPGVEPTIAYEDLNFRIWRYTTPDGQLLADETFMRSDWKGEVWSGIVGLQSFPDEYSPTLVTREHIQERIEAVLVAEGYEVRDALAEPTREERLQAMADARAACKTAFADFSVDESIRERRGQCAPCPVCEARKLSESNQCPSCGSVGELVSVQGNGPNCALNCPKCGAGWQEDLSEEVIAVLLGAEEEPTSGYGAFKGGDPRLFIPDEQVCTPEELGAHRKACEEADAMEAHGEVPDWPGAHGFGQAGGAAVHVERSMFGLGVYQIDEHADPPVATASTPESGPYTHTFTADDFGAEPLSSEGVVSIKARLSEADGRIFEQQVHALPLGYSCDVDEVGPSDELPSSPVRRPHNYVSVAKKKP